jgi:hypothetical protein
VKGRVGLRLTLGADPVHEQHEFGVARRAAFAVGQVFRRRRIRTLALALGQIAFEQPVVLQVKRPAH